MPDAATASTTGSGQLNAFSVDVEDYYQVGVFEGIVKRQEWPQFESRVERNTQRLLELFDEHGVKATFFVLGCVAETCPQLILEIERNGHEIASHGYDHRRV